MSDAFCPLPFSHLIINHDGTVSPCCVSDERYRDANGRAFLMDRDSLADVWNGTHIAELRSALASGIRHAACENCWAREREGHDSHRLKTLRGMDDPGRAASSVDRSDPRPTDGPGFVTIRYGNVCNLKCRICGPAASSRWIEEHNETWGTDWLAEQVDRMARDGNSVERRAVMNWFEGNDAFWEEFRSLLPGMHEMMFTGGEPFLIRRQVEMLRECAESGHAEHINLQFHTNGTVLDDGLLAEVLPRFRSVIMNFSTDGTGRQFEYQRHGASWDVVDGAMRRCLELWSSPKGPRGTVMVNLTVSAMNAYYLPDYGRYFGRIGMPVGLNLLVGRPELDAANLPWVVRKCIAARLNAAADGDLGCYAFGTPLGEIIGMLEAPPRGETLRPFLDATRRMDISRGESFADAFPEMADLVGYRGP